MIMDNTKNLTIPLGSLSAKDDLASRKRKEIAQELKRHQLAEALKRGDREMIKLLQEEAIPVKDDAASRKRKEFAQKLKNATEQDVVDKERILRRELAEALKRGDREMIKLLQEEAKLLQEKTELLQEETRLFREAKYGERIVDEDIYKQIKELRSAVASVLRLYHPLVAHLDHIVRACDTYKSSVCNRLNVPDGCLGPGWYAIIPEAPIFKFSVEAENSFYKMSKEDQIKLIEEMKGAIDSLSNMMDNVKTTLTALTALAG